VTYGTLRYTNMNFNIIMMPVIIEVTEYARRLYNLNGKMWLWTH
jgi:hypothetical protein